MASEHIKTRRKIENIDTITDFNDLINQLIISPEQKEMMRLHYVEDKNFNYIADVLGYSESSMKKWHTKILKKISKLI